MTSNKFPLLKIQGGQGLVAAAQTPKTHKTHKTHTNQAKASNGAGCGVCVKKHKHTQIKLKPVMARVVACVSKNTKAGEGTHKTDSLDTCVCSGTHAGSLDMTGVVCFCVCVCVPVHTPEALI